MVLLNHTAEETGYDRHPFYRASTLLVAIDISKHRHEVLIGVPGKKRRRRMTDHEHAWTTSSACLPTLVRLMTCR